MNPTPNDFRYNELEERVRTLEISNAQHTAWSAERDASFTKSIGELSRDKESMWAEIGKLKWNRALVLGILTFVSSVIGSAAVIISAKIAGGNDKAEKAQSAPEKASPKDH